MDAQDRIDRAKKALERLHPAHDFQWQGNLCVCPFHKDSSPSMSVYQARTRSRSIRYYCFGCSKAGDVDENIPVDHLLKELVFKREKEPERTTSVHDISWAKRWRQSSVVSEYLRKRGVREPVADFWKLRAADTPYGPAVLIPNRVVEGCTDYYQLRYLKPSDGGLRYMSPPDGEKPLYHISRITEKIRLTLVEGVFDALALGVGAIPLLGKTLTEQQMDELRKFYMRNPPPKITICLDGGEKEREATKKLLFKLRRFAPYVFTRSVVSVCLLPDGKDPGDLGKKIYEYEQEYFPKQEVKL